MGRLDGAAVTACVCIVAHGILAPPNAESRLAQEGGLAQTHSKLAAWRLCEVSLCIRRSRPEREGLARTDARAGQRRHKRTGLRCWRCDIK
ncbi:MAG: hypothetical protein EBQ76_02150 [Betaproteobacteria bacterium]|nr:hypothetical protein [Betaproteobacteria bacterium]NDF03928.1 hypothetical protein [Betaproteobacteria bacterium]